MAGYIHLVFWAICCLSYNALTSDAVAKKNTEMTISPPGSLMMFIEGGTLKWDCTADKDIEMEWQKDYAPGFEEETIYKDRVKITSATIGNRKRLTLEITDAGEDDITTFICSGSNGEEKMVTTEMVSVFKTNTNLTIGSDTVIECKPNNLRPTTEIVWFKDKTPLNKIADLKDRVTFGQGNMTVTISQSKRSDVGVYECRIIFKSIMGRETQEITEPVSVYGTPYIDGADDAKKLQESKNGSIILKCPARGNPPVEIFWYADDELLPEDSSLFTKQTLNDVKDAQLKISNMTEYRQFKCDALNDRGKASMTFDIGDPDFSASVRVSVGKISAILSYFVACVTMIILHAA